MNLKEKFDPTTWKGFEAFSQYKYAGMNLIDDINALDPDLVIDAGCGHNRFKGHIKNLIGFDQSPFPYADIIASFDEITFRKESADVVMCLGSIQFGDLETVDRHLAKCIEWTKPGGYLVVRILRETTTLIKSQNQHYFWTNNDIDMFTTQYNLTMVKGVDEDRVVSPDNVIKGTRLVWWWQKPGALIKHKIDPVSCTIEERHE